jgi:hypothetical protein
VKLRIAGSPVPVPELPPDESLVEVWRDRDGAVCAWAQSTDGECWMHLPDVASYRFPPGGSEITAIRDPSAGSQLVVSGYERTVLPMAVQLAGREVLHASAVLTVRGVVAFCAVATTGKSTIAQAFSRRGYGLWADDAVAFETAEGSVTPLPLPFQPQRLPPTSLDESRATARALSTGPTPASGVGPLCAVCVLERAERRELADAVRVRRPQPAEAFPAVLAHAYCYTLDELERNRRMIDHYLDLSARVAVFSVIFQPGLENLPAVLDAVERAVGMAPRRSS